jgi:hypothetical protein
MTASGTPVIHVETHLASVCQGGMAVVIRTDSAISGAICDTPLGKHAG